MVDYNQCLTPAGRCSACACWTTKVWQVEEPTLAHDYAGHASLHARRARRSSVARTVGELDLQHALDANASDYVMPDVMKSVA
jgi:mandelate racemase